MKKIKKNIGTRISTVSQAYTKVQREIRKSTATAVLAAFAFVIALVWRDAIQDGINALVGKLGISGTGYIYRITATLLVTVICVLGIVFFSRWSEKSDDQKSIKK